MRSVFVRVWFCYVVVVVLLCFLNVCLRLTGYSQSDSILILVGYSFCAITRMQKQSTSVFEAAATEAAAAAAAAAVTSTDLLFGVPNRFGFVYVFSF